MIVEQGEVLNKIDENVESAKNNTHEGVEKLEEVCKKKKSVVIWNHQFYFRHRFCKKLQDKRK